MAQNDDAFDIDDNDLSDSDLVKRLRKVISDQKKTISEQEEELNEFYSSTRESDISEALVSMGVDSKISRFVPDSIESVDELETWVEENADVFGVAPAEERGDVNDVDREHIEAAEMMAAIGEGDIDPDIGLDLASRIENAGSQDELMSLLKGNQ
jgi:hypothetical protein